MINLTKDQPSIGLDACGLDRGVMTVRLDWHRTAPAVETAHDILGGLRRLGREVFSAIDPATSPQIDLDLGCLWELADGRKGVIQALGRSFGNLDDEPWIELDGDDRAGDGGETLRIDVSRAARYRRILVFAYIYSGIPAWPAADARLTLGDATGMHIETALDHPSEGARTCAVAMITYVGDGSLTVTREMRYIHGAQAELDRAYGWGLRWTAGKK